VDCDHHCARQKKARSLREHRHRADAPPARHRRWSCRERRRWPARMLRGIRRLCRVSFPSPSPSRTSPGRAVLMDANSEDWPALGHGAAGRGVHVRFDAPTPMDRDEAPPSRAVPRARADRPPGLAPAAPRWDPRLGGFPPRGRGRGHDGGYQHRPRRDFSMTRTFESARVALFRTPRRRQSAGWTSVCGSRRLRRTRPMTKENAKKTRVPSA
jgi:hypothetical protein